MHPRFLGGWIAAIMLWNCSIAVADEIGLPPKRFYSLDDIADIIPGFRVGFDPLGRIMVVQYNKILVLNDDEWIDLIEDAEQIDFSLTDVTYSSDGVGYFASHGFWGELVQSPGGRITPVILSPPARPEWTLASEFERIVVVDDEAIFYNWNGLVYYDSVKGKHEFLEIRGLERVFSLNGELYLSIFAAGIMKLNLDPFELEPAIPQTGYSKGLSNATAIGESAILFSNPDYGFIRFDGAIARQWHTALDLSDIRNVVDICGLPEGNIAVAVERRGIFVISPNGKILQSLTSAEYQGVKQIVSNEAGIFWFSTDTGVGKVYYGSGVTIVDQRSGLQVGWPEVCRWDGGVLVSSDGKIYESIEEEGSEETKFQLLPGQPDAINLSVSAARDYMFIGNAEGVIGRKFGGAYETILPDIDVTRVIAVNDNFCYVISTTEIAALSRQGDRWVECADRIPGYGFPAVIHSIGQSVWMEMGLNRVVRISFRDGKLSGSLLDDFPWQGSQWINIGSIGNRVVLNGKEGTHLYFDEETESFVDAPDLDEIFALCPFGVWRTVEDENGTIWVSHVRGVSELRKRDDHYEFILGAARIIREPTPILRLLGTGDLWVISRYSLYHVSPSIQSESDPGLSPRLASVLDARSGIQINQNSNTRDLGALAYNSNTLSFRFFSGTYLYNNLSYHVEMRSPLSRWSIDKANSSLTIPNLKEGRYEMRVTLMDRALPLGDPMVLQFTIRAPWYRSALAYVMYGIGLVAVAALIASVPVIYIRNRNRVLEILVHERTQELEQTMVRLRKEESARAVHEERSRIANEIHDSVQQGLSGLGLILDSALKYRMLPEALKARLQRAKTILRFTHEEVKHAVWNIGNPLLNDKNLLESLEKIASLMTSNSTQIDVSFIGDKHPLPTTTNHHLIRIAQESITNAIRHGSAHHIAIVLEYRDNEVILSIRDDGCGFNVDEVTKSPHQLGLRGMLNRSDRFNGEVSINSEIKKGTCITITVPIEKAGM